MPGTQSWQQNWGIPSLQSYSKESPDSSLKHRPCWVLVAHTYNPSYSGGRYQKDWGSKLAWANSSQDPFSKTPDTRKGWLSGSRCRPWAQTLVLPKGKKKKKSTDHGVSGKRKNGTWAELKGAINSLCTYPCLLLFWVLDIIHKLKIFSSIFHRREKYYFWPDFPRTLGISH
jgi:hypothetical protein